MRHLAVIFAFVAAAPASRAGLYYSGEPLAELPSQWRGFLLDQRLLRNIAIKPAAGAATNPARARYQAAADSLEQSRRKGKLSADQLADLGALYIRLGDIAKALDVLRIAEREHPDHFRIAANLGTAWQLQGDLGQAAAALKQAVRLAPGKWQKAEEYQLKLVRLRQLRPANNQSLDNLFGVGYLSDRGRYEPGKLAAAERGKLPSEAVALTQQLALWLPADGRLLWQLAELANAHGDVKTAAAIMDGCVNEFGLYAPELRQHRQATRAAADALPPQAADATTTAKAAHEEHAGSIRPKSKRPLLAKLDLGMLPPINIHGVTPLPWSVLAETSLDRNFKPTFAKYLQELDGKQITLAGYMQPLGDDLEATSFMLIEYPVGCWYCEMPDIASIVFVELLSGRTANYTRGRLKVTGQLRLNATDPENFLYTISKAKVVDSE
jgi:tetratricopeptide (TPR) repeat protein